jgi:hypothetical protein
VVVSSAIILTSLELAWERAVSHNTVSRIEVVAMLTPEQLAEFQRCGILRLPGAVSSREADTMCDSVWDVLRRRYGIRRDDPETWKAQRISGTKDRPKSIAFEQIANPGVCTMFDNLLGAGAWERAEHWGSLLVSFPGAFPEARDGWYVPHQSWHLDAPVVRSLPDLYGVRLFTCLAKLSAQGGATLAVAGSHLLAHALANAQGIAKMRSADVRKAMIRRYAWMKELCSPDSENDRVRHFITNSTVVEDVELRVVEMTGDVGDAILVHPLIMHAASPNCLATPRIVLSTTVYQRGIDWNVLYGAEREAAA